ncbi:AbrB/MazE/SpoVT family DNA-binding domain-containing protein [Candidatus Saganbacteria bacterium]|nr:AbrB/MazE/SpoVT family DNA-binding domain-containing protein [Candidatus Saganbacteria bacterium]
MAERIFEKNKIKLVQIPEKTIKHVGLRPGSYVEVSDDGYHIILTPIEENFTDEEWKKILLLKKEKGRTFRSGKAMLKHLRGLMKK